MNGDEAEKSPMDHFDYEGDNDPTPMEILAFFISLGPFGIFLGWYDRNWKVFLWGVGTTLLVVAPLGFFVTADLPELAIDLGLKPHIETFNEHATAILSTVNRTVKGIATTPTTYVILFIGAVVIVAVGSYRLLYGGVLDDV